MIGAEEAGTTRSRQLCNYSDQLMTKSIWAVIEINANGPNAVSSIIRCVDAYFTDGVGGFGLKWMNSEDVSRQMMISTKVFPLFGEEGELRSK